MKRNVYLTADDWLFTLTGRGLSTWRDKLVMGIVWRLPRWVIYWAVIRFWAHGTTGQWGNTHPDELTWSEACKRWETEHSQSGAIR